MKKLRRFWTWEGFAIEQLLNIVGEDNVYFWGTHGGAELDLLLLRNGKRVGFEFKYQDAPRMTPSMRSALEDLKLDLLWVVYPGEKAYPMAENVRCVGVSEMINIVSDCEGSARRCMFVRRMSRTTGDTPTYEAYPNLQPTGRRCRCGSTCSESRSS